METITANDAKQNFGVLMDKALSEPVTITKHGRAAVVVTSDAEYQELISLKYAHLKAEIGKGFLRALTAVKLPPRRRMKLPKRFYKLINPKKIRQWLATSSPRKPNRICGIFMIIQSTHGELNYSRHTAIS